MQYVIVETLTQPPIYVMNLILMKGNLHYMLFLQQLIIIQGTLEIKS